MIPIAQPILDNKEKENIIEVLDSGMLAEGEFVRRFEEAFCTFLNAEHGVATNSGTAGLHVALKAAGIEKGDRVVTTPFSFIATTNALLYCGARPVFVDIKEESYNIDPEKLEQKLKAEPDIKALLIVHLFGRPCSMDRIMELVDKYNLILIEDCAQAHGASFQGKKVGTFGRAAVFSFYPTKNMTTAEGGIVVTGDRDLKKRVESLIRHGSTYKYYHEILGYNYRMNNLEAALGVAQIEKLEKFNRKRRANAAFLNEHLRELDWLQTPKEDADRSHVYHLYTVSLKENSRDKFADYLKESGIGCGIYYPLPVYRQPLYKERGYGNISLPVVEKTAQKVISLPVHPALTKSELRKIVECVRNFKNSQ